MSEASDEAQYVTLCLATEVFAVPVSMVREILEYRESFRIPDGPAFMKGLIDVRGQPVPVIDLRLKLGMPEVEVSPLTRIMVVDVPLEDRTLSLGLVADKVLEVASFASSEVSAAPDVGISWRSEYISGVVRREEGFVVLFNLPKLLTSVEIAALTASEEDAGDLEAGEPDVTEVSEPEVADTVPDADADGEAVEDAAPVPDGADDGGETEPANESEPDPEGVVTEKTAD